MCTALAHFLGSQPPQSLHLECEILLSSYQVIGKSTFCSYLGGQLLLGYRVLAAGKSVLQCPIQPALPSLLGGMHHTCATIAAVQSQLVEFLKSFKPQFAPRQEGRTWAGVAADTHRAIYELSPCWFWPFQVYTEKILKNPDGNLRKKKIKQDTTRMYIPQVKFAYLCLNLEINTTPTSKANEANIAEFAPCLLTSLFGHGKTVFGLFSRTSFRTRK